MAATTRTRLRIPIGRILFLALCLIFLLAPLYWMFDHVDQAERRLPRRAAGLVPGRADDRALHRRAVRLSRPATGSINSLIISIVRDRAVGAVLGTLMAYSLARFNTGGQHLSFWVLSQRFLPPIAVILPIFLIYRALGLHDTHIGLIIAYTVFTLPVTVWMMFAYFRQMPRSLEEAALVDGCTRWQAFWRVAVPLAAPGIVAAAVFAFIACWTEFFFALLLTSRNAFTLPTVFRAFTRLPGRAIWRGERALDRLAGAVDRARHSGRSGISCAG